MSIVTSCVICSDEIIKGKQPTKTNKCIKCCRKLTYDELIGKLADVTILTTEEEWNMTSMNGSAMIKSNCINIDCNNEAIFKINNYNYSTRKCSTCIFKISYKELQQKLDRVTILTTEEEWNLTNKITSESIKIKCINDDCNNDFLLEIRYYKKNTLKCNTCICKISYKELIIMVGDAKLLTSAIEWNKTTKTTTENIIIECINENCKNERIMALAKIKKYLKICKQCIYADQSKNMKILQTDINGNTCNPFNAFESELISKLTTILQNDFILKKTNDGCKCDLYIKPIDCKTNDWLQIQLKTTKQKTGMYNFNLSNNTYNDMIIILYHFIDNKYWLIDGSIVPRSYSIRATENSKYGKYITEENKISSTLMDSYKLKTLFNETTILGQLNKTHTIEHTHRQKRENLLKQYFTFEYPETDCMVFDLKINNFKVQDKTGEYRTKKPTKLFQFVLKRSCGKKNWYDKDDNDFYWFYNTVNSMFIVIPSFELAKEGYVIDKDNDKQVLKSSFTMNFDDYKNHKFAKYVFDYNKLDINKLKNLIK